MANCLRLLALAMTLLAFTGGCGGNPPAQPVDLVPVGETAHPAPVVFAHAPAPDQVAPFVARHVSAQAMENISWAAAAVHGVILLLVGAGLVAAFPDRGEWIVIGGGWLYAADMAAQGLFLPAVLMAIATVVWAIWFRGN